MTEIGATDQRADVQISLVISAAWFAILLSAFWGVWPPDLSALYYAGQFWSEGRFDQLYLAQTDAADFAVPPA